MLPAGSADRLRLALTAKRWADGSPVLGALSLSLGKGEVVALSGPSGAGKSTLLAIIAGLDTSFEGRIQWQGRPRLSMMFQSPRLLPWRSALDNVALALGGGEAAEHSARQALAEVGLAEQAGSFPAHLSLGMARRVALARALVVEPDVLLLDEAFVSLDGVAAAQARALVMAGVRGRDMSVLMVSHDAAEMAAMAHRHLRLAGKPGRLEF